MNSPSVGRGHIINATRRLSEKLIIIWKLGAPSRPSSSLLLLTLAFFVYIYVLKPRESSCELLSFETRHGKRFSWHRFTRDSYVRVFAQRHMWRACNALSCSGISILLTRKSPLCIVKPLVSLERVYKRAWCKCRGEKNHAILFQELILRVTLSLSHSGILYEIKLCIIVSRSWSFTFSEFI